MFVMAKGILESKKESQNSDKLIDILPEEIGTNEGIGDTKLEIQSGKR